MAKKPQLSPGSKQVSSGKLGENTKEPSPLMGLAGGAGKKDYAKKPKSPSTEIGSSPFGMTGLTGET
jgi:hypothetical protein